VSDALQASAAFTAVDPVLHWLAATALALLFAAAAVGKLRDLRGFRDVLDAYELVPRALTGVLAPVLGIGELALAIALCVPGTWFLAAWAAIALLTSYAAAMGVNLMRGRTQMNCGCMGAGGDALSPWLVARNLLLLALPVLLLVPQAPRALVWVDAFTLLAGLAALALVYRLGEQLIANHHTQRRILGG
jgi:hypothetical protein